MKLRFKILSGFLILATMLAVASAVFIYELNKIGSSVQRLLDDNYKSIYSAKMMIEALEREDSGVLLLLSGKRQEGRETVQIGDELFEKGFTIAKNNITIPGEDQYVEAIRNTYETYKQLWLKPIVGTQREHNLDWYFEEVHWAFLKVKSAVEDLMSVNAQTMYRTASDLKERAHRGIMPGIVAVLAALVFTVIFNYLINYYLVSPILRMTREIQKFLTTQEPVTLKVETRDELFDLASAVRDLSMQCQRG
jgi:methyl-accepting chemotaxis protein